MLRFHASIEQDCIMLRVWMRHGCLCSYAVCRNFSFSHLIWHVTDVVKFFIYRISDCLALTWQRSITAFLGSTWNIDMQHYNLHKPSNCWQIVLSLASDEWKRWRLVYRDPASMMVQFRFWNPCGMFIYERNQTKIWWPSKLTDYMHY